MADHNVLFNLVLALFFLTLRQGEAELLDVRLVDGTKPTEGTVMYTDDCETWNTTCGTHLAINDVIVFCRHLGFAGANRALQSSPFMSSVGNYEVPMTHTNCGEGEGSLSNCSLTRGCSPNIQTPGGAVCYASNYLGCYKNNATDRVLKGRENKTFSGLMIDKCIAFCRRYDGMVYAGVEFGQECYCGDATSNYSKYGNGTDIECQYPCDGSQTENCGGTGYIAIFDISADPTPSPSPMYSPCDMTTPRATTSSSSNTYQLTSTTVQETSDSSDITATATTPVSTMPTERSTTNSSSRNDIALYAAIGAGVAGVAVICIVIIILVCICRHKSKGERNNDVGLKDVALDGDDTLHRDMMNDQKGKVENDAFTAQMKRGTMLVEYDNMKDRDKSGVLEPEASVHLSYENVLGKPATSKEGDDLNRLYAMPAKRRPEPEGEEHAKDTGSLYAMPEKNRKSQVSHSAPVQPLSHDSAVDSENLYAMPEENGKSKVSHSAPVQPPPYHFAGDNGDLYAMPEKNRKSKMSHGSPVQELPDINAMYAMPNKPKSPQGDDNETVMIENELYG